MSIIEPSLEKLDAQLEVLQTAISKKKDKISGLQRDLFEASPEQDNAPAARSELEEAAFSKKKVALLDRTIAGLQELLEEENHG